MKQSNFKMEIAEWFVHSVFLLAIELFFRVIERYAILDWATVRILLSSFGLCLFITLCLSFCKSRKKRNWVWGIFFFVISVYSWIQIGFRNFLGMYISLGVSGQAGAVTNYISSFLQSYEWYHYLIFIPFILYCLFLKCKKKEFWTQPILNGFKMRLVLFGGLLIIGGCYFSTLYLSFMQNPMQLIPNNKLFYSPTNSSVAVNQYGPTVYVLLDIKQLLFPTNMITAIPINEEELIDDTEWLSIIKEETNATYNTLNRYFINRPKAIENDYTGYFEGKNVIVVMMESVSTIIENGEYFPNFQRLLEHSWYWENNYSPRGSCATGDNEFSGLTSLYSLNTTCTTNTYQDNTYFEAMFNRFKASGYQTFSFHDYDDTFYARSVYHPNMGSEHFYDANELSIPYIQDGSTWPDDSELMEKAVAIMADSEEPFMTWITTVSAHLPYFGPTELGERYMDLFEDTDYSYDLKNYLSKLKVTDDALGVLLDSLEAKGLLCDTVIVLYGDHYPYGLSEEDVASVTPHDVSEFYDIEKTPFLIYNSALEPKVFTEKTSYMNILPTLANLFRLDYDARFYFGSDLLNPDFSGRVVFADGSWEDDVARYDASNSTVTYFGSETYTIEEIRKINEEIYTEKEMSNLSVTTNYFDYLEKALNEKKEEEEDINEQVDDRGVTTQE